jgi:tetratricopeptide (TPR) repeat protein
MKLVSTASYASLLSWCRNQLFKIGPTLGDWCIEKSKYPFALLVFKRLALLDPSNAKSLNGLGHVYFCLGHLSEALDSFQRAVVANPSLTLAYQNLGYVYGDLERYTEAISAFQEAIRLESENARPYHGLGLIYTILGDIMLAKRCFERSMMLDPAYVGPRISLAGIYKSLGQEAEYLAEVQYLKTQMNGQKNYTKARFLALCNETNESLCWLEKVVAETPGYRWTIQHATDFVNMHDHPRFRKILSELPSSK